MNCLTIITILLSFCLSSTLQMSRLCDRNETSLVIDSAVAYYTKAGLKVMLFSGDQLYDSQSVNMTDYRIDFTVKSIKELNETLEPPIDIAYNDVSDSAIDLCLIKLAKIWRWCFFEGRLQNAGTHGSPNHLDIVELSLRGPTVNVGIGIIQNNFTQFQSYDYNTYLMRRNDRTMKLINNTQLENNTEPFDGSLEGIPITAAFNWTQSRKEYVYMFAGRHLCKQEISETNWVPMCNITDISNLIIDCTQDRTQGNHQTSVGPQTLLVMSSVVISLFHLLF